MAKRRTKVNENQLDLFQTTRVTNPTPAPTDEVSVKKGKKLKGKALTDFNERMDRGKRQAAAERRAAERKKNPSSATIAGINVTDVIMGGVGVAAGAYVGGSAANIAHDYLISKLPEKTQGLGFGVLGLAAMLGGAYLEQEMDVELPVSEFGAAVGAMMMLRAFDAMGIQPLGAAVADSPPPDGTAAGIGCRRLRRQLTHQSQPHMAGRQRRRQRPMAGIPRGKFGTTT